MGMWTMKLLSILLWCTQSLTNFKAPCPVLPANTEKKNNRLLLQRGWHHDPASNSRHIICRHSMNNGSKGQSGFITRLQTRIALKSSHVFYTTEHEPSSCCEATVLTTAPHSVKYSVLSRR